MRPLQRIAARRRPIDAVLVTGAASGIGAAAASALAARYPVLATDVDTDALAAQFAGWHSVRTGALDVSDRAAWRGAIDTVRTLSQRAGGGRLLIVNCAGRSHAGSVVTDDHDLAQRILDTNVMGAINAISAAVEASRSAVFPRVHVVNVASFAGLTAVPGLALYSASKHAVRAYSLAAWQELRMPSAANAAAADPSVSSDVDVDVDVSVVAVDAVDTPMLRAQVGLDSAAVVFAAPRLLRPEEVAEAIITRVLPTAPAEITIPRGRGVIMKLGGMSPRLSRMGSLRYARAGAARQRQLRAGASSHRPRPSDVPDPDGAPYTLIPEAKMGANQ